MSEAGIKIIAASSPQAKGRVERNHGTHQDRLIKKLRRRGLVSYETANRFLQDEYLAQHNRLFARRPIEPQDYHRRRPSLRELQQIFRLESERVISNDWVVRHDGRWLQLHPGSRRYGPTQSTALVCEYEDGSIEVYYRGERVRFHEIAEPIREVAESQPPAAIARVPKKARSDHPWRLGYEMRAAMRTPPTAPPVVQRPSASP